MAVPYTFGSSTSAIPLSQLDSNFATPITLGNTAVYLGNSTSSLGNLTLTNVTISSVSAALTPAQGGTGITTTPANGALLIGNGSGYSSATLTAGTNVTITNGAGTITIAATGGGGGTTSIGLVRAIAINCILP
jgi:hypothetical protein